MPTPPKETHTFPALLELVKSLRGPDGCPWDKKQTHESLAPYVIEEAHELAEALEARDLPSTVDELGDVLFQVVLHAELGRQSQSFTIEDVLRSINEKMIRRHPHVFSTTQLDSSEQVVKNWEKIKAKEKGQKGESHPLELPANLPALVKSYKIGQRTSKLNFDWDTPLEVLEKVDEELLETKQAINSNDKKAIEHEIGDLLFSMAQLARHLELDPEQCLRKANRRFKNRFQTIVDQSLEDDKKVSDYSREELEALWVVAKSKTQL